MANIFLTGITNNGTGNNGYIRYFDPSGSGIINALSVTCTDSLYVSNGGFGSVINGLVLDPTNTYLFVADGTLHCIWQINLSTNVATRIAGTGSLGESNVPGPALSVNFSGPRNMCVDAAGNLYVIDRNNVLCLNRQATTQTILNVSIPSGNIANVAGTYNTNTSTGDGGAATSATFTASVAGNNIACDASGNLYISDGSGNTNAHRVRIVNSSGIINNFVGGLTFGHTGNGDNYQNAAVLFGFVCGIAFDTAGNFYVADYESSLRAINLQGTTQTLYNWSIASDVIDIICDASLTNSSTGDGGQARAATIYNNNALVVDSNGVLYLSQPSPHSCIRAIDPSTGVITTICGTGGNSGNTGDGGAATSAVIESQVTIAVQQFAPAVSVTPSTLTMENRVWGFQPCEGTPPFAPIQQVSLTASGSWTATADSWLLVSPSSGTGDATVTIAALGTGLPQGYGGRTKTGQYSGTVTFASGGSTAQVAVSLEIGYGENFDGAIFNAETGEATTWFELLG